MTSVRVTREPGCWPMVTIDGRPLDNVTEFSVDNRDVTLTVCPDDLEIEGLAVVEKREHDWVSERVMCDSDEHQVCICCGRTRTVKVECEGDE